MIDATAAAAVSVAPVLAECDRESGTFGSRRRFDSEAAVYGATGRCRPEGSGSAKSCSGQLGRPHNAQHGGYRIGINPGRGHLWRCDQVISSWVDLRQTRLNSIMLRDATATATPLASAGRSCLFPISDFHDP